MEEQFERETGQKAWQDNSMNPKQPSHAYVEWLENKVKAAKYCFDRTIWMAVRYAHRRSTYAPHDVRDAVNLFKQEFPDWELGSDDTIKKIDVSDMILGVPGDSLHDLFEE